MDRPEIFRTLNEAARAGDVFSALRRFPLDVVADAMLDMPTDYPDAHAALPRMASDAVQDLWTGNHGHTLLFQSIAFARSLEYGFLKYTGRTLEDAKILDYGCGWGRLLRLMYAFSAPDNLYGCDPYDKSIDLCQQAGIQAHLALCDYLPKATPFPEVKFDLIYAFSVFTHLSERTSETVLAACRKSIADNGIMAVTIRPNSYWDVHSGAVNLREMHSLHAEDRFAFTPHAASKELGSVDTDGVRSYGDASFSLNYVREKWTEWELVGTDVSLLDAYQTVLFLKPRLS